MIAVKMSISKGKITLNNLCVCISFLASLPSFDGASSFLYMTACQGHVKNLKNKNDPNDVVYFTRLKS